MALEDVREVLRVPPVTEVPHAPRGVAGIATVHGVITTVLDLGPPLGFSTSCDASARLLLLAASEVELVGLRVDAVDGIVRAAPSAFVAPEIVAAPWRAVVDAVARLDRGGGVSLAMRLDRRRVIEVATAACTAGEEAR
jgi:purine-binding chemotaxis protein CheW